MIGSIILALLGIIACAACAQIPARICDERELCAPEGRLPTTIPPVGPRMAGLMEDIITSAAAKHKRGVEQEGQSLVQRGLLPNYACCESGSIRYMDESSRLDAACRPKRIPVSPSRQTPDTPLLCKYR